MKQADGLEHDSRDGQRATPVQRVSKHDHEHHKAFANVPRGDFRSGLLGHIRNRHKHIAVDPIMGGKSKVQYRKESSQARAVVKMGARGVSACRKQRSGW